MRTRAHGFAARFRAQAAGRFCPKLSLLTTSESPARRNITGVVRS
ncbi:MAG: hypothetical protein QOJ01_721 [Solirubrobacterales bacterium]|jgi:hypothetical protein|nr:hypothetical protein [Solirubrobacterales bacterium]